MKKEVKNTTLVITDPCYIKNSFTATMYIDEPTIYGDWSCFCYIGDKEKATEISKEWNDVYSKFFHDYNFGGLSETEKEKIYEEYKEKKKEFKEKNTYGEFCSDSGNVAVYDYSTLDEKDKDWIKTHEWCACIIPDYSGEFEYVVETDDDGYKSAHIVGDNFFTSQSSF